MGILLQSLKVLVHPKYDPETKALPGLLNSGDVAFDIGAHFGQYTRVLSRITGSSGHVYAFEPAKSTYTALRRACRLLKLSNATCIRAGLSDETGEASLHTPIKENGSFGVSLAYLGTDNRREYVEERVPVMRLDDFVRDREISSLAFIKCDVEGAECKVLTGAQNTLRRFRPAILCEVNSSHLLRHGQTTGDLELLLKDLEYRFFTWRDGRMWECDTLQKTQGTLNYFFIGAPSRYRS